MKASHRKIYMNTQEIAKAETEELEIIVRLILQELTDRFGTVNASKRGPTSYNYAKGILNDPHSQFGCTDSSKLIRYAYENHGMEMARIVYRMSAPCRMNPETTIVRMAKHDGWVEYKEINKDPLADLRKAYIADRTIGISNSYTFLELDKCLRKLLGINPNDL